MARLRFVVNPRSAGGRTARRWRRRADAIRAAYPDAEVVWTDAPRHAVQLARAGSEAGCAAVIAVGGDGTVHEVVNGLMEAAGTAPGRAEVGASADRAALGVLPSGTGSDFARGLGIGPRFDDALAQLRDAVLRTIDVGRVRSAQPDAGPTAGEATRAPGPECFVNVASFGASADVVARVAGARSWLGAKATYLLAATRTLLRAGNPRVRLTLDDAPPWEQAVKAVAVANQTCFGGGMGIAPDARPDSGHFQVAIFGALGRLEAIRRLRETYRCQRIEHPKIDYCDARRVRAESIDEPVGVELDGEWWGTLPAEFTIAPAALRVLVPR